MVVFSILMYHEYKGLLSSQVKPCEVSIFPFHVMMGNSFFLSFFLPATLALLINYGKKIGGGVGDIYVVLLFQRANCTIFLLFKRVSRPSDVLI